MQDLSKFPKISVITASYNSEATIEDTLRSLLNQTYSNYEYIIIDGGSTDKTIELVKNYELKFDGKLKWLSEKDNGIYHAWNKGIKMSSGEWISFVGSDDVLIEDALQNYANAIIMNPKANFISSRVSIVKKDLTQISIVGKAWSNKMKTYNCIAHVGSLHKKSLYTSCGLYDTKYKIVADYDFLLRCMPIINASYIPVHTAKMRVGGVSNNNIFKVASETLDTKIFNNTKSKAACYFDYIIMISKYFIRSCFYSIGRLYKNALIRSSHQIPNKNKR